MPIRVTLEIIPRGDEKKKFVAGVLDIENDGTAGDWRPNEGIGHYDFTISGPTEDEPGVSSVQFWERGRLEGFERNRGYWSCVKECLQKLNTDYQI